MSTRQGNIHGCQRSTMGDRNGEAVNIKKENESGEGLFAMRATRALLYRYSLNRRVYVFLIKLIWWRKRKESTTAS